MKSPVILISDQGRVLPQDLKTRLPRSGFEVIGPTKQVSPLESFRAHHPDLMILGIANGNFENDINLARQIRRQNRQTPIICVARRSSERLAIAALKAGVNDYFKIPFSCEELVESIKKALPNQAPSPGNKSSERIRKRRESPPIVGQSKAMQKVKQDLSKVAQSNCTVLITGETGTGKELAARTIHCHSDRYEKPLICINCAAIPDSLVESELFGYERGAFTGAVAAKQGLFEASSEGTVFLDEIGDMTPLAQAKILRTIELKESHRLGSQRDTSLNFRVIAATNREPETLITEKRFRKDLFYRLNVARIHMPPLRDHKEDLPLLVDQYLGRFNARFGRCIKGFTQEAMHVLFLYDWPGNVRELKNLIEVSSINLPSRNIDFMDMPQQLKKRLNEIQALPKAERDRVVAALCATNWNKSKAAQKLNWSRMTLYRKIAKYQIDPNPHYSLETEEV